jgi:hypothetical protein
LYFFQIVEGQEDLDMLYFTGRVGLLMKEMKIRSLLTTFDQTITYEYDMGSTTETTITYKGTRKLKEPRHVNKNGLILMRNEKPSIKCVVCNSAAKYLNGGSVITQYPENEAFCSIPCAEIGLGREYRENMLSELYNSPRSGECGYRGMWCHPHTNSGVDC